MPISLQLATEVPAICIFPLIYWYMANILKSKLQKISYLCNLRPYSDMIYAWSKRVHMSTLNFCNTLILALSLMWFFKGFIFWIQGYFGNVIQGFCAHILIYYIRCWKRIKFSWNCMKTLQFSLKLVIIIGGKCGGVSYCEIITAGNRNKLSQEKSGREWCDAIIILPRECPALTATHTQTNKQTHTHTNTHTHIWTHAQTRKFTHKQNDVMSSKSGPWGIWQTF